MPDRRPARPTMKDVAALAGVGLTTVSRVVNGDLAVTRATVDRVEAAIAELQYRRNDLARALRPGMSSNTLGLLLGDLTNPFYAAIAKAAVYTAREAGYAVVLSMVDEDPSTEQRAVHDLVGRQIAGLISVPGRGDHAYLEREVGAGTPVVFVDRPAIGVDADVVVLDNERGGRLGTEHLIAGGHRRIAALVARSHYTTGQRVRGYRRALRDAGLPVDDELVLTIRGSASRSREAMHQLLDRDDPPSAVFATTNFLTEGVVRALHETGTDVSVVGFDDFSYADIMPMPVSVVSGDVAAMGAEATRLLLDRIAGNEEPPRRVVLPVRLTHRGNA